MSNSFQVPTYGQNMERASIEIRNRLEFEATRKKRAKWWNLTLLGRSVLKHRLKATTDSKSLLLLLDMSIPYFSFPATISLHA